MTVWDAPNQQVVREDGSAPWDEGTGGSPDEGGVEAGETKSDLLARAQQLGVSPANAGMTKEELQAGIDAKLAEEPA